MFLNYFIISFLFISVSHCCKANHPNKGTEVTSTYYFSWLCGLTGQLFCSLWCSRGHRQSCIQLGAQWDKNVQEGLWPLQVFLHVASCLSVIQPKGQSWLPRESDPEKEVPVWTLTKLLLASHGLLPTERTNPAVKPTVCVGQGHGARIPRSRVSWGPQAWHSSAPPHRVYSFWNS